LDVTVYNLSRICIIHLVVNHPSYGIREILFEAMDVSIFVTITFLQIEFPRERGRKSIHLDSMTLVVTTKGPLFWTLAILLFLFRRG
jgi:hypothetical protein